MTAIAIQHKDEILDQIADGAMLDVVAKKLGIAAPNISKQLSTDPAYKLARQIGAGIRLERSRTALAEIADMGVEEDGTITGISKPVGNLARVRESRLKADQWFAEREFPEIYGQKPTNINIINGIAVDQALDSLAGELLNKVRVIEGEVIK